MKTKVYFLFIAFLLQFTALTAQNKKPVRLSNAHNIFKIDSAHYKSGENLSFDFEGFSATNDYDALDVSRSAGDTLNEHLLRTTRPYCYPVTGADSRIHALTGSNIFYMCLGQKFKISGAATFKGLLIPIAQKRINGAVDSYRISVWNAKLEEGNDVPNTDIGFEEFTLNDVDTCRTKPVYNYIPINSVINLPEVFFIFLQTRNYINNEDGYVVWSNTQGDANHANSSCFIRLDDIGLPVYYTFSEMPLLIDGETIDIDILILPVIEKSGGTDDSFKVGEVAFKGIYPTPASGRISFDLSVNDPCPIEISILSSEGNVVAELSNENISAGDNHFDYDISDLASGNYFLVVNTQKGKFAVKFQVVK